MNLDKKKSFVLYPGQYECFSLLPADERGNLILALFEYQLEKPMSVKLSPAAQMAYVLIRDQIERDGKKYLAICEKRKLARSNKCNQVQTSDNKCNQVQTSATDNEYEYENVDENDNEYSSNIPPYNPPEGKKKKTNNHSSIIGTEERDKLIRKFFRMYGNPDDDELDFIAYNEAREWKGIGEENILASENTLERYVSRWCRSENVRFGRKESESL